MGKIEERESIVFENEGQKIFGIIHRPLTSAQCPAILMCHGLAGQKTGKYRLYVILAEKLAELGIASLRIDFRGSGDSEGSFEEMTLESEISDALKGLEFLEKLSYVDTSRLGIFGRSVGGTVALIAAARYRNIKSIATWAALFDGNQWIDQWNLLHSKEISEEHRHVMMRVNGQVPGYEFFKQLFDIRMEKELEEIEHIPFLNIHGAQDAIVAVEHSSRYADTRKHSKGKNKFICLPHSDHDFSHPKEQAAAIAETCHWFAHTL